MTPRTDTPPREPAFRKPSDRERWRILRKLEDRLEFPMAVLGLLWLVILIIELVRGTSAFLIGAGGAIWTLFIIDFLVKFIIAPKKLAYLKSNWLTALSLAVPALRVLRIAALFPAFQGARLVRIVASMNQGMRALRKNMGRRGFGYVMAITAIVMLGGAAGMYAFEQKQPGFANYPTALYWTVMLMTTIGSEYWPRTPEGRVLCMLLSVYSIAVFGYITASLATYFIDRDAGDQRSQIAGEPSIRALKNEIAGLRQELRSAAHPTSEGEGDGTNRS
jgi:voltage-gated potassium channel